MLRVYVVTRDGVALNLTHCLRIVVKDGAYILTLSNIFLYSMPIKRDTLLFMHLLSVDFTMCAISALYIPLSSVLYSNYSASSHSKYQSIHTSMNVLAYSTAETKYYPYSVRINLEP